MGFRFSEDILQVMENLTLEEHMVVENFFFFLTYDALAKDDEDRFMVQMLPGHQESIS